MMDKRPTTTHPIRIAVHGLATVCATVLIPAWPAFAESPGSADLQINGFGTVGSLATQIPQPWTFRRDYFQPNDSGGYANTLIDSRVGVQANYSLGSQWELAGQAVARRQVPDAPISQLLQWAFVSYRPLPDLALNIGRRSQDIFLIADYRDVGFAYPWVRPNVDVYSPLPLYSTDGADMAWTWHTGSVKWNSKTSYGVASYTAPTPVNDLSVKVRLSGVFSETLSGEYNGLTVKLSYQVLHLSRSSVPQFDQLIDVLRQIQPLLPLAQATQDQEYIDLLTVNHAFVRYLGLGAMYDHDEWLIHSEVSRINGELSVANGWRGYSSIGYRIGSVIPFVMVARTLPKQDVTPLPSDWVTPLTPAFGSVAANLIQSGAAQAVQSYDLARMDQRSVSLGMRWDFAAQTALKLQWDYFHVYDTGWGLWGNNAPAGAAVPSGADYANVFSATLDFLF
jgi:hypothetical protein